MKQRRVQSRPCISPSQCLGPSGFHVLFQKELGRERMNLLDFCCLKWPAVEILVKQLQQRVQKGNSDPVLGLRPTSDFCWGVQLVKHFNSELRPEAGNRLSGLFHGSSKLLAVLLAFPSKEWLLFGVTRGHPWCMRLDLLLGGGGGFATQKRKNKTPAYYSMQELFRSDLLPGLNTKRKHLHLASLS